MSNLSGAASSRKASMEKFLRKEIPETLTELETECALIEAWSKECEAESLDLMKREDPQKGLFFPQEIYELRQEKNMLASMRDFRRARINRMKFMKGE